MRTCTVCHEDLPLSEFSVADKTSGRLRGDCRRCCYKKAVARKEANRTNYREVSITANRKYKYGVTREQVIQMLNDQIWGCAVCDDEIDYMTAHLDHCHATGKVRGLLCRNCNRGLGGFKDNIQFLSKAIAYLGG
jgi:hypothetical protein